jgi:hypothetical protein
MNLLKWLPKLTTDDREVIAVALRTGPSKGLMHYGYYRDAAKDRQLPLLTSSRFTAAQAGFFILSQSGQNRARRIFCLGREVVKPWPSDEVAVI